MMQDNIVRAEKLAKVIPFRIVDGKEEIKRTKEGEIKKTKNNKEAGKSSEVFALKSKEEISAITQAMLTT